jgi:hypothetical protein
MQHILPALLSASINYARQTTKARTKISVCKQVRVNANQNSEQMKGTAMKRRNVTLWHTAKQMLPGCYCAGTLVPPDTCLRVQTRNWLNTQILQMY